MNLLRTLLGLPQPPCPQKLASEAQRNLEREVALLQEPKRRLEEALARDAPARAIREAQRRIEEGR